MTNETGKPHYQLLAFDFGLRHIGVAVGQSITETASPLETVAANNGKPEWQALGKLVSTWQPALLIVGLPLNMDGSESNMSQQAQKFAATLEKRFSLPVHLVDERLTSFAAQESARESARKSKNYKQPTLAIHSEAAVLIAQGWFNQRS